MKPTYTRTAILTVQPTGRVLLRVYLHTATGRRQHRPAESWIYPSLADLWLWRADCRIIVREAV